MQLQQQQQQQQLDVWFVGGDRLHRCEEFMATDGQT